MSTGTGTTLTAKVVFLGDAGNGAKTSLVLCLVRDVFHEDTASTVGAAFLTKDLVVDGVRVKLEIWGLRSHSNEETHTAL